MSRSSCHANERFLTKVDRGDCGSWVIDGETGDLYGHVVAGSPESRVAFIMPALSVRNEIKEVFGRDWTFPKALPPPKRQDSAPPPSPTLLPFRQLSSSGLGKDSPDEAPLSLRERFVHCLIHSFVQLLRSCRLSHEKMVAAYRRVGEHMFGKEEKIEEHSVPQSIHQSAWPPVSGLIKLSFGQGEAQRVQEVAQVAEPADSWSKAN